MGSALLALLVHLDGSGAVTFLVTVPAMLPLYERLRMDRRDAGVRGVAGRRREFSAVDRPDAACRRPALHIPRDRSVQAADSGADRRLVFVFIVAYMLGRREERRLATRRAPPRRPATVSTSWTPDQLALRRPGRFWINCC